METTEFSLWDVAIWNIYCKPEGEISGTASPLGSGHKNDELSTGVSSKVADLFEATVPQNLMVND